MIHGQKLDRGFDYISQRFSIFFIHDFTPPPENLNSQPSTIHIIPQPNP